MDGRRWHAAILGTIAAVSVIVLLFFALSAHAADQSQNSVTVGSVYQLGISACTKKQSAIDVLDAEKLSHEHAGKLFDALDECQNVPLRFRVGAIVHTVKGDGGIEYRVVEILSPEDPKQKLYWLTSMQIVASVTKPGEKQSDAIKQPSVARQT